MLLVVGRRRKDEVRASLPRFTGPRGNTTLVQVVMSLAEPVREATNIPDRIRIWSQGVIVRWKELLGILSNNSC